MFNVVYRQWFLAIVLVAIKKQMCPSINWQNVDSKADLGLTQSDERKRNR